MELFLDLDGVFADFDGHYKALTGVFPWEVHKKVMWKTINSTPTFFLDLPLMKGADRLWEVTKHLNPTFLTGAPSNHSFREQKHAWVAKTFGPEWKVIVLPKKDKHLHAHGNAILIDDTEAVIDSWFAKGGLGILHVDVDETIEKLGAYVTALRVKALRG